MVATELGILGEILQYVVEKNVMIVWTKDFADIEPGILRSGFQKLRKTWKPDFGRKFPAPGDLTAILDEWETLRWDELLEKEWTMIVREITKHWHPDVGWKKNHEIPVGHEDVIAFCGGVYRIWDADASQLVWIKKEFLAHRRRKQELLKLGIHGE